MNTRILLKQLGQKSTLKIRDYCSSRFDEDIPDFPKSEIGDWVEMEKGDIVWVISLKPPTPKEREL